MSCQKILSCLAIAAVATLGSGCLNQSSGDGADAEIKTDDKTTTTTQPSNGQETALIPRTVLFGNPEKAGARLSPDGKWLSYLAPVDGVMNVFVAPVDDPNAARAVTEDKKRGIRSYSWAYTGKHILYTQDANGDENWHVYATDVASGTTKDLTPMEKIHASVQGVSRKFPDELLVGLNNRVPQLHDIYRINITTGEMKLVQKNPGVVAYITDDDFKVRFAVTFSRDGGQVLTRPDGKGGWDEFLVISPVDAMTTRPVGFDKTGNILYLFDSRKRNTGALVAWNLETDEQTLITENSQADVSGIIAHPTEKTIQAVSFTRERQKWQVLDKAIQGDLDFLGESEEGELVITARTLDDKYWTVAYLKDDGPVKYFYYDRGNKKLRYLFSNRNDLDKFPLQKLHPVVIKSRDGLDLVSYLTLPPGSDPDGNVRPTEPVPMVLLVHGGPWARDRWGFNPQHQWLANRGYAVLSVNFRGSTGFGKEFINAANRQWSRRMHDDLLDAVNWAVAEKIAIQEKVAIMGGSYGGYATLVGLTFTPEVFACGVDIVGPSNLVTLLENVPPYWIPMMPMMKDRLGDISTEEGRKELLSVSPLTKVDQIVRPLLIGQGANDPRVTQVEADQIVAAMQQRKIPVTYVLYPDEGHGFARPANRLSFNAVTEAFLAKHLGGRHEPIGESFGGATISVPTGKEGVPGLSEALQ